MIKSFEVGISEFNLLFSCEGINLFESKEQARKHMIDDYSEEDISLMEEDGLVFEDTYEKTQYAIFRNMNGNIIIFETQCFDYPEESLPDINDLIEFVANCLSDEINDEDNDSLIVYVYKTFGTDIDYTLIYDYNLYSKIENLYPISQIGEVLEYIKNSINESKNNGRWKYSIIVNGCYIKLNNNCNDSINDIICDSIDGNIESFWESNV